MLSKHPDPERDTPATSPALARRRDHMLRSDPSRQIEPRLVPSGDDAQRTLLSSPEFDIAEDDSDPDIPPPPQALRAAHEAVLPRAARVPHRRSWWPAAVAVSVVAISVVAWLLYDRMAARPGGGEVPVVAAEAGPEKIRPQQEGGLEVPNQGIHVYSEVDRTPSAKESEVLLPAPEAPVAPPAPPVIAPPVAESVTVPVPPPPEVAPAAGAAAPAHDALLAAPTAATPEKAKPVQTATTVGAFRIQLAAVKSREAAQAAWKKLTKTHPDVLKGLALNVVKVDRGADGALFRVQGGPFADRAAAESACGKLKQKSQACLVVAP